MSGVIGIPFRELANRLERIEWQGNDVLHWSYAVGAFVLTWIVLRALHALLRVQLRRVAERTRTRADDLLAELVGATRWIFHFAIATLVARAFIDVPKPAEPYLNGVIVVALFLQGGLWIRRAVFVGTRYWVAGEGAAGHSATVVSGIDFAMNLVVWMLVALLILTNLGVEVSALLAGLGVGGIAAALALQSLLADAFAGVSMYFDRPFEIGDFIVIEPHMGQVTKIGLRTTRLRSPEGDELIVANGDLVKARIKNFARLQERRVQFGFSLEYGQSSALLREAQRITREVVQQREQVRLDRAHFKTFTARGLEFEIAYFVTSPDYNLFMDTQQAINLELYERFEQAGIRFAFDAMQLQGRHDSPDEAKAGASGPTGPGSDQRAA